MDDTWQPRADGPYDWRTEGPLAYYYHVEPQGYTWDTAPLPPEHTLRRWLRFDPYAFQIYWPRWYELASEGQWDALYPLAPESPPTPQPNVVLGPVLGAPLKPVYAPRATPSNPSTVLTMAADAYTSPVDGANDLPDWMRALDTGMRWYSTIVGLETAKRKQQDQAAALEGADQHPVADARSVSDKWQQIALVAGVAAAAAVIWVVFGKVLK